MLPKGYLCFLGKHSSHTAFDLNKWANENNIHLNLLPKSASDLHRIENIWIWLNAESAQDCPRNVKGLKV